MSFQIDFPASLGVGSSGPAAAATIVSIQLGYHICIQVSGHSRRCCASIKALCFASDDEGVESRREEDEAEPWVAVTAAVRIRSLDWRNPRSTICFYAFPPCCSSMQSALI